METALEEVSSCPIGGGLVQVEKVVLGHLLEEVNLKGHWIHRLSDGGGGERREEVWSEECHVHKIGTCTHFALQI